MITGAGVNTPTGRKIPPCELSKGKEMQHDLGVKTMADYLSIYLSIYPVPCDIDMSAHPLNSSWSPHPKQVLPDNRSVPSLLPGKNYSSYSFKKRAFIYKIHIDKRQTFYQIKI